MVMFDPAASDIGDPERVPDLPGGGLRTIRKPLGIHGVWINGAHVFDGEDYGKHAKGPGHVLRNFVA